MKILLYTDNHFCATSSIMRDKGEKYSLRLENQLKSINWLEQLSIEHKCTLEIHCGDFFEKETLSSEEISALKDINWNYNKKEFIVGNHEIGSGNLEFNSVYALNQIGDVIIKPTLIVDKYCNIIMIPYIVESNRKSLKEYIDEAFENTNEIYNKDLPIIIFTHNLIDGLNYGGFKSNEGFSLTEIQDNCRMFFDGHLHNKYCLNYPNCLIQILGDFSGLNFSGDASKYPHCAYILDTETLAIETFENPYAFNFYKLEYPFNNELKDNAIVSIKVKQSQVEQAKAELNNNKKIIKSRITIIPEKTINSNNKEEIISKDHIQQFKVSFKEKEGTNEIIEEELGRL